MRRRATSAWQVLRRHLWAIALLGSRTSPGPATLRHLDAVIGTLWNAGFSVPMTAHAFTVIDSYVYGFAVQAALPFDGPRPVADVTTSIMAQFRADGTPTWSRWRPSTSSGRATTSATSSTSASTSSCDLDEIDRRERHRGDRTAG